MNDDRKHLVGDAFIDSIITSGVKANPEYNPKIKKGRTKPPYLVNTSAPSFDEGLATRFAETSRDLRYTGKELGFTNEDIERDAELGISLSPYNTEDELNKARAENQSNLAKAGNFLMQAGVGEVILGTMEGFGNIADGIINSFTRDNYGVNPYTQYMQEAKENLKDKFRIYRENPNASWEVGDFGWWMDNLVSAASTASIMLPAAGWARGLSALGKVSGASKVLSGANRWASRAIAGAGKAGKVGNKFGALRTTANKANRLERTFSNAAAITGTALLSRTGENYMEAKAIYDDVYTNSLENLQGMIAKDKQDGTNEFGKFLANNPEFKNMSVDDIAKEIARKSANTTFINDYAMLLMDVPQFKALGKLWGNVGRRSSTASERIAAQNLKRTLAGEPAEKLIKDNIINRTKEGLRYAFKNPRKSLAAMELGEGIEEMYQGIQTEKGMEVAAKYFDPIMTTRTLGSYLSDGSIWEQGFWGVIGGITFNKVGRGIQAADKAIRGAWNKKHMSAEEYEKWKRSNTKVSVEQLNNMTAQIDEYISDMRTIQEGKNPYDVIRDPETGVEIIGNGKFINQEIDETQARLLQEKAISKFVDNVAMDSMDYGTFEILKEALSSPEFDKYIADNGLHLDSTDKALSQEVLNRMKEVSNIYENVIKDVDALADTTNPFITRNVARNITRNKLQTMYYDDNLANIQQRIAEANDTGTDYSAYTEREKYETYKRHVENLVNQKKQLALQRGRNELSESAYQAKVKEINKTIETWNDWAEANTAKGALEAARKQFSEAIGDKDADLVASFNNFITEYEKSTFDARTSPFPPETIRNLIDSQIDIETKRNYTISQIPTSQEEYEDMYNEFSRSMDMMELKRRDDYLNRVKQYLRNADNLDEALDKIYAENTGNDSVDEALHYLRYLYDESQDITLGAKGQFFTNIDLSAAIEEERERRNKGEEVAEEAAEEGLGEVPESDAANDNVQNDTQNNTQEEGETDKQGDSSTGGVPQSPPATSATSAAPATETQPINQPEPQPQGSKSTRTQEPPPAPSPRPDDTDPGIPIDDSYDTPSLRGDIKARQYIMQIGFKEPHRIKEIADAMANNDNSKRDAFLREVAQYLIGNGFERNLSIHIAGKALYSTVNLFAGFSDKNESGKAFQALAQQLALGFGRKAATTMTLEDLIDGKGIDEIVDDFLTEYSKIVKNDSIGDGKTVINIESLFNYLLDNANIDANTAMYIYNNLSRYINTHDGSKYIFTGFNTVDRQMLSATEFMNQLKENKAQTIASVNKLHISPIELRQRATKKAAKEYREAVEAAHNGTAEKVYLKPSYATIEVVEPNGSKSRKVVLSNFDVIVEHKKGKNTITTKVGILRTVECSPDGKVIHPIRHQSGFRNAMTDFNSLIFDCDFLFNAIVHKETPEAEDLWKDITDYYYRTRSIVERRRRGEIDFEKAQKLLNDAMSEEVANRIMNNSYIKQAVLNGVYKFDIGVEDNNVAKARDISSKIAAILLFNNSNYSADSLNFEHNSFAIDEDSMANRYNRWKQEVKANYEQTAKFQEMIEDENTEIPIARLKTSFTTTPNIIPKGQPYNNIGDLQFDFSKTIKGKPNPNYTPLVFVRNGRLRGEDGEDYGEADPSIGDYSMGIITYMGDGIPRVAYFQKDVDIKDSKLVQIVKNEVRRLIYRQINNLYNPIDPDSEAKHEETFTEIGNLLTELFGNKGIFRLGNYYKEGDITVNFSPTGIINVYHRNSANNETKSIIAFFEYGAKGARGHAIKIYDKAGNEVNINSLQDTQTMTAENTNKWIEYALDEMFSSVKLNRSSLGFSKKTISGGTPTLFTTNPKTGAITFHLNGKDYTYGSYADFLVQNRGFTVNVYQQNGSFVTRYMNENRLTADFNIKEEADVPEAENHAVFDMLYTSEANYKRKTADTVDILKAAGVDDKSIDIMTQNLDGRTPLVTKRITVSPDYKDAYMYYNRQTNTIHMTPKGAMAMTTPATAIRLIMHENIHRHFNSGKISQAERDRITTELQNVYDYAVAKLKEHPDREWADKVLDKVLKPTQQYATQQKRMEEFLVECLTQRSLTEWLNNTEYTADADITGIAKQKKSILQKIVDIILNLLGINNGNIKNNSILAHEYVILSNVGANKRTNSKSRRANATDTNHGTPPVEETSQPQLDFDNAPLTDSQKELNKIKAKLDTIRRDFEARITRSPNFAKDHTYLLDGDTPIDYSVTQKIHGKQDIGDAAVPSSTLGNTADATARGYFENNGAVPDSVTIPNVNDVQRAELINGMKKIEEYLNNRHGKGRYRVLTEEFPIGGTITVNGQKHTIAGTMDMIVYTDSGEIYIYDFKTRRQELDDSKPGFTNPDNGKIVGESLYGYSQQVNIYRQILEENYPELKNKVHTGGLIKFSVSYPLGKPYSYRTNPNNSSQLQVSKDGTNYVDIQDSTVTYFAPAIGDTAFDNNIFIEIPEQDYGDEIGALPEIKQGVPSVNSDIATAQHKDAAEVETDDINRRFINDEDIASDVDESFVDFAVTEDLPDGVNTSIEIYAPAVADGAVNDAFGVTVVTSMDDYVARFPTQFQPHIKQLIATQELNYTCS